MNNPRSSFLRIISVFLGNLFEHYLMALYGLLSPLLAPLFFPSFDPLTALILTYGIIPLGMLMRPVGSLFFGYLGDHLGRESVLFLSLVGMSIVSCLIGLTPTYSEIGILAPLLLSFGKITQNFLASGEVIGGAVYLLEHTHEKHHNLISSLYDCSTVLGIILASAGIALMYHLGLEQNGWRFLYYFGCITALFGSILRWHIQVPITTKFKKMRLNLFVQSLKTSWKHRKVILTILLAAGFGYSTYSIALVMINGFIPHISSITNQEMISLNTWLLLFDLALLPFFGSLANVVERQKMMITAALLATLTAIPAFTLLENGSLYTVILVRIWFVIIGVSFSATFYSWSQNLVPKEERYTVLSFGYALGTQLLGGPTATFSLWIYKTTGIVHSVAWYWMALGAATILAIALCVPVEKENKAQPNHS